MVGECFPLRRHDHSPMKTIAGSILILAAAVLLQPTMENQNRLDEVVLFAGPVFLFGLVLMIGGLRSKS